MRGMPPVQACFVLTGFIFGAAAFVWGLPEQVSPSWTVSAGHTLWLGAPLIAFLLPTALTVIDFLLRSLCVRHPVDEPNAARVLATYKAVMLRVTVFVTAVHAVVLLAVLGLLAGRAWAGVVVPLMLGFTLISVGNLLPKTRPNLALGIRTRETLADPAVWMRVHRWAGYMTVAAGAVIVVSAIALPRPVGPAMILLVGPATAFGACLIVWMSGTRVHT
jgi:uncharacterized membrane protein